MVYSLWDEPAAGTWCGRLLASSLLCRHSDSSLSTCTFPCTRKPWKWGDVPSRQMQLPVLLSTPAKTDGCSGAGYTWE